MSAAIQHHAQLPFGYSARFTWTGEGMAVEWTPAPPLISSPRARRKFRVAYSRARREFVELVATTIDGNVLVADIDGGSVEIIQPAVRQ